MAVQWGPERRQGRSAPTDIATRGAYAYDANGNLTAGGGLTLDWNVSNQPTVITDSSAPTIFAYGGGGERVKKARGSTTTIYPFGDDFEISGGIATRYVSVPGLGVVAKLVGDESNPTRFWLHADRLGSIQAVTDAAGVEVLRRSYEAYGDRIQDSTTHAESRGYIDQREDETGLLYLHARYYDPALGIFISPDPLHPDSPGVGLSRYSYGFGDPVNGTDRSGLAMICSDTECRSYTEVVDVTVDVTDLRFHPPSPMLGPVSGPSSSPPRPPPPPGDDTTTSDPCPEGVCPATPPKEPPPPDKPEKKPLKERVEAIRQLICTFPGYADLNISAVWGGGLTFGWQWGANGNRYRYIGPAVGTPGVSLTCSTSRPRAGWYLGAQGAHLGVGGQVGYGPYDSDGGWGGGSWFGEGGLSSPGVIPLSAYRVIRTASPLGCE